MAAFHDCDIVCGMADLLANRNVSQECIETSWANHHWCWVGVGKKVFSSVMIGKEAVVVTDAVKAVPSSKLVRVGRIVRTWLCALSKCEAIKVDMINPKDWLKWQRGSIALYEPPKNSRGWEAHHIEFPCLICCVKLWCFVQRLHKC